MKHHHVLALSACTLALALAATVAHADPAPGAPDAKPGKPHGKPVRPSELFGKPEGKPGEHPGKPDEANHGEHGKPGKPDEDKPEGRRGDGFHGGLRELHDELKAGKIKKDELKDKLAKLRETAGERGKQHRLELSKRWGGALGQPSAVEELKHHARRMALLDRALVLAETEAKDKAKLTERITKLIDKENERHERAMERLKSMPAPATGAGAAPAAPSAAAPATSAASDAKGDAQ